MNTNLKLYTIKITEKECLWIDVAAATEDDATKAVQMWYEDGECEQMRRECDGVEFEVVDVMQVTFRINLIDFDNTHYEGGYLYEVWTHYRRPDH